MALALILRNASKMQVGALQRHVLKTTSVVMSRDISCSPCQKYQSVFNKNNHLNLNINSHKQLLLGPQVRLMSADHSKLWALEKALSASLIVLIPAAIALPNFVFDNLLSIAAVIHFHWGLEAVVVDYARPIVVGNILPKVALGSLYLISALTLGGLIYYNVKEIGVGRTIRKIWSLNKEK